MATVHFTRAFWAGLTAVLACLLCQFADPQGVASGLRERWFDQLLLHAVDLPASDEIVVVDIDRESLGTVGPWPWPRAKIAELMELIGAQKPRSVATDIVFQDRIDESPLDREASERLERAVGQASVVLGMALDPETTAQIAHSPPVTVSRGDNALAFGSLIVSQGLAAPGASLLASARSIGFLSLLNEDGAPVRGAPLLAVSQGKVWASLPLEAIRIAEGEGPIHVDPIGQELRVGRYRLRYPADGVMRLSGSSDLRQRERTISAAQILARHVPPMDLAAKIVLVGSSAPEAGGLRPTIRSAFTPSVQIHADAATQIIADFQPMRPGSALIQEVAAALMLGGMAVVVAGAMPPTMAFFICVLAALAWLGGAVAAAWLGGWLIDAVWPVAAVASGWIATSFVRLGSEWRTRIAIERRFSMHLAPEVVARIVADPRALRMSGERRELTALFTDIEGFTAMTEHADPADLIALLDQYVELVCASIRDHKGMVDKVVGDAVHAFFNAPIDLPDHADQAIACAADIQTLTEAFRKEPLAKRLDLGRTRIGIETGPVIVGDIGGPNKLDYTAHGAAVNLAARLEAFNKTQRTSIAIGPGTVKAADRPWSFERIGELRASAASPEIPVYTLASAATGPEPSRV